MIDKDTLSELYVNKNLTSYEIAQIYQVDNSIVQKLLIDLNIDKSPKQRKYELIKKVPFTQEQRDAIVGILLGQNHVKKHGDSYRLEVKYPESKKELTLWIKSILGNFINVIHKEEKNNSTVLSLQTATHNELSFFHKLFYENNKKVIRTQLINYLTPLSVAIWFSDQGEIKNHLTMKFNSNKFSKSEQETLQYILKVKFNVRTKICTYLKNNIEYHYLSVNKENSEKLTEIIKPYAIYYQSLKSSSTTLCQTSESKNLDDDKV
jgi:hypothetical protein